MHKIAPGTLKNMPEPIFDIFEKIEKIDFLENFIKFCILDITHHLRGFRELWSMPEDRFFPGVSYYIHIMAVSLIKCLFVAKQGYFSVYKYIS